LKMGGKRRQAFTLALGVGMTGIAMAGAALRAGDPLGMAQACAVVAGATIH
jgi:thiazole synthase ThiGH ThiG subunit